jgi:adenylylsulfate kinase
MEIKNKNGLVIWLFGLSGSGKSTLSKILYDRLTQNNIQAFRLDGDDLRKGLNADLGFSVEDRSENIRRAAEVSKILSSKSIVTICSFITPLTIHRQIAKQILQQEYFEVFIDCSLEECENRDVKGLYQQAHHNAIKDFTGIGSGFERPKNSHLILSTEHQTIDESSEILFNAIIKRIKPDEDPETV